MALKPVTIVGGGLAGLALGIALRRRELPVHILEAGSYPRHRVCGEFLSGIREHELAGLGIQDLLEPAARHRSTAWFDGARPLWNATLPEPAYGLSRHHLDEQLHRRFLQLGGTLQERTRFAGNHAEEGTVLASGRPSRPSPWLGLKAHFKQLPLCADLEVHLGQHAYVGLTRVEDGRVNVTGLFRRTHPVKGSLPVLIQAIQDAGLSSLASRLLATPCDDASLKGVNHFHLGWQSQEDGTFRIGDAAALIPPFTGNGMSMALLGALDASELLPEWSRGATTWEQTCAALRWAQHRRFGSRLRWAHALQWLLLQPAGRRLCAAALQNGWVSFDSLYRKVR
ncbi:MAG: hypothetical protein RLZZ399_2612 [Verrucomicrobiota bacterium]|jgi:flavin-dependent dehydrogenase